MEETSNSIPKVDSQHGYTNCHCCLDEPIPPNSSDSYISSDRKENAKNTNSVSIIIQQNPLSIDSLAWTCSLCDLPFSCPVQCMKCDNIFCRCCIESYMLQHSCCACSSEVMNLLRMSIEKQKAFTSVIANCELCSKTFPVLDTQSHFASHHDIPIPVIREFPSLAQPLQPRSFSHEQESLYSSIANRIVIDQDDPRFHNSQCQICFDSISIDSTQCYSCGNIWCTPCYDTLTHTNKLVRCPYRCSFPVFGPPSRAELLAKQIIHNFAKKCSRCDEVVPLEYKSHHNRRVHGDFVENPKLAYEYSNIVLKGYQALQTKVDQMSQAIYLKPSLSSSFRLKGTLSYELGQHIQAIISLRQALTHQTEQHANDFYHIGMCYLGLQKQEEFEIYMRKTLAVEPLFAQARVELAKNQAKQGLWEDALKNYSRIIGNKQFQHLALAGRGNIYLSLDREEEALEEFNNCIFHQPTFVGGYLGKAKLYMHKNELTKALQMLEQCTELDENNMEAHNLKLIIQQQLDQNNKEMTLEHQKE